MGRSTEPRGEEVEDARGARLDRRSMLPSFLVIGAMKGGTDSIYRYLRAHPQVFMASTKELHFFVEEINWSRGRAWYEQQFSAAGSPVAVGEASTSYSKYPFHRGVPERIAGLLPEARLIYLVRHPIDRIRSQYLHHVLMGDEKRSIEEAIIEDSNYVHFSMYAMQIEQYLQYFPRERFLVVVSEELRSTRARTMRRVHDFLGIDIEWTGPALQMEHHRTEEQRVLRAGFRAAQRIPGYKSLAEHIPDRVRRATQQLRTRGTNSSKAILSQSLVEHLEGVLRDDVGRLRTYISDGFDGWGIG